MNNDQQSRAKRIIGKLQDMYPGKASYDLDGRGEHFVCEVEPVSEHPEYDRAIEVIISSKPHKHLKMTQWYTIYEGSLELHVDNETHTLYPGDKYVVQPGQIHWARSDNESLVEIYSKPGWNKQDHIMVRT